MNADSFDPLTKAILGSPSNTLAETEPGAIPQEARDFDARSEHPGGGASEAPRPSNPSYRELGLAPDQQPSRNVSFIDAADLAKAREQVVAMQHGADSDKATTPPTIDQIFAAIDQMGPLKGSHRTYSVKELKEKVLNAPLDEITRAGGLREMVTSYRQTAFPKASNEQQKSAENHPSAQNSANKNPDNNRPRRAFKDVARKVGFGVLSFVSQSLGGNPMKDDRK